MIKTTVSAEISRPRAISVGLPWATGRIPAACAHQVRFVCTRVLVGRARVQAVEQAAQIVDYLRSLLDSLGLAHGQRGPSADEPNLSEREQQILLLIAQGQANKEIARSLDISAETVKWHLKNLFCKLHVTAAPRQSPGRKNSIYWDEACLQQRVPPIKPARVNTGHATPDLTPNPLPASVSRF